MHLLSCILVLLLGHNLGTCVLISLGVLVFYIEILIHLVSLLLVSLHDAGVSSFNQAWLIHHIHSALCVLDHDVESIGSITLRKVHGVWDDLVGPEGLGLLGWRLNSGLHQLLLSLHFNFILDFCSRSVKILSWRELLLWILELLLLLHLSWKIVLFDRFDNSLRRVLL